MGGEILNILSARDVSLNKYNSDIMNMKKRQINIEILRIISMILVLLNHSTWNAKYFNIDMVHTDLPKAIGVLEVYGWIFVCVPCFIAISGYFGIRWKWKGLFNYLFQIGFWGGGWSIC